MTTLPNPTATFTRSWATHPRPTADEDRQYRQSCVNQAFDAARAQGVAPVTPPDVIVRGTRLTVSFRTVKTSALTDEQRRATDALRTARTLAEAIPDPPPHPAM